MIDFNIFVHILALFPVIDFPYAISHAMLVLLEYTAVTANSII